jgi:hypothetical protein
LTWNSLGFGAWAAKLAEATSAPSMAAIPDSNNRLRKMPTSEPSVLCGKRDVVFSDFICEGQHHIVQVILAKTSLLIPTIVSTSLPNSA